MAQAVSKFLAVFISLIMLYHCISLGEYLCSVLYEFRLMMKIKFVWGHVGV